MRHLRRTALVALLPLAACVQPVQGPTPTLDAEVDPAQACNGLDFEGDENAGVRTIVTLNSADGTFSPLPVDLFGDTDGGLELPRVFMILDGEETEIPDVHFLGNNQLEIVIDTDPPLAPGIYQFIVQNPNGNRSPVAGEIEIVPPPHIERVERADTAAGESDTVCLGVDVQMRIIGTGFRPDDSKPQIEIVSCTDEDDIATCETVIIDVAEEEIEVVSETEVLFWIRAGQLPDGSATYGVRLSNPEEPPCQATHTVAFSTGAGQGTINTIVPEQGWTGTDTPIQVYGADFDPSAGLRLLGAAPGGGDLDLLDERTDTTGTRIDATVPEGGVPGGPYPLAVSSDEGCETILEAAFTILADPSLSVTDVIPPFGWTGSKTPVTILGTAFESTPRAYLIIETMEPRLQALSSTGFVTPMSLNSVVPDGLDVGGPYDLVVINPDGGGGKLEDAFRVTMLPPPLVDNVVPAIGTTQDPSSVLITGCNLRDAASVELLDPAGASTAGTVDTQPTCTGPATCDDGSNVCTMAATFPTDTMLVGAYVVRVTNLDETTWGDWSLFVVTLPSGKLDVWSPGAVDLVSPRRQLAGVSGRINNASRFLYAIGGDGGMGGAVHDTLDVVPLDIFGDVGTPFQQRYRLNTPRTQVNAVQEGGYVWVVGGSDDGINALNTIERAKILTLSDQPELDEPSIAAGNLGAGAWYYQVAAFYDGTHADNPNGETLPSDEVVVALGIGGGVGLSWTAVPNAAGYRLYRTEAADGVSSTEAFLTELGAGTLTFVDDGSLTVDASRVPLKRGATGVFVEQTATLIDGRRALQVGVGHDPAGDAFLYAIGGLGSCGGAGPATEMDCYEFASLSADGSTLGAWTAGTETLVSPRAQFALAVGENDSSDQVPVGESWLFATGGLNANAEFEAAQVTTGGQLSAWTELTPPVSANPGMRSGHTMQLVANAMFVIGGDAGADLSGPPLDGSQFSQDFNPLPPARSSWSNSTAVMNVPRALYTLILESGLFYAIGGSTDPGLTDATNDIESIVY